MKNYSNKIAITTGDKLGIGKEIVEKALGDIFDELDKEKSDDRPLPYSQPTIDDIPLLDTTKDLSKREVYRKKHEKISRELDDLLRYMKIQD